MASTFWKISSQSLLGTLVLGFCLQSAQAESTAAITRIISKTHVNQDRLTRIDRVVADGIRRGNMPGCVVLVQHEGQEVFFKAYGNRQLKPNQIPMTKETVFDLASLTKPIATATSIMLLVEQGKLQLNASASKYLPDFKGHGKENITIQQLLTHQGGLIPDNSIKDYHFGRETAFSKINELTLRAEPGEKFIYSDVGFIVLGNIVEEMTGQRQDEYVRDHLFKPLQMHETGYLPREELRQRAATTQEREGRWMQGEVHDPRAYAMDGVAGHAGLFSTAKDLARYGQMILNQGQLDGVRVLKHDTVKLMSAPIPRFQWNPLTWLG